MKENERKREERRLEEIARNEELKVRNFLMVPQAPLSQVANQLGDLSVRAITEESLISSSLQSKQNGDAEVNEELPSRNIQIGKTFLDSVS